MEFPLRSFEKYCRKFYRNYPCLETPNLILANWHLPNRQYRDKGDLNFQPSLELSIIFLLLLDSNCLLSIYSHCRLSLLVCFILIQLLLLFLHIKFLLFRKDYGQLVVRVQGKMRMGREFILFFDGLEVFILILEGLIHNWYFSLGVIDIYCLFLCGLGCFFTLIDFK